MEYHRRGPHQGFWRLKANWNIPNDADMLKMVGPEQVVLSESMQVGQRHLQDSGYSGTDTAADDDESNLSIEQQLAPWITTKNFLFATQAKAMLRLHGEGDPTGRGEAFSFIRVSMKDIFVKAGEDYDQKLGTSLLLTLSTPIIYPTLPSHLTMYVPMLFGQLKPKVGPSLPTGTTSRNNNKSTNPRSKGFGERSTALSAAKTSRSSRTTTTPSATADVTHTPSRPRNSSTKSH